MPSSTTQAGLPDEQTIAAAANLTVQDETGATKSFGELFSEQKTIVVFVRHFFCGMCQAYVTQIASSVPQATLDAAGVKLVVVGCGEPQLIEHYKKETGFAGPIYADPSRFLYKKLGMATPTSLSGTPAGEPKRNYVGNSVVVALKSLGKGLMHPLQWGKQGNIYQLGGEFVFGPDNICLYAHIMKHAEDHAEVSDIMKAAGVEYNQQS